MERVYIPFGVPFCHFVKTGMEDAAGNLLVAFVASPLFYGQNKDTRDQREVLFGEHANDRCAGEGLMLWDQNGVWDPRGKTSQTRTILKYKPRALTVGVVTSAEPEHTHRMHGPPTKDQDQGDRLPGYSVGVRWWDNITGRWVQLRPYISANYGAKRCASEFAQEQKVFFTFVMYDRKPRFLRALGTHLPHWMAVNVQAMIVRSKKTAVDGTTHLGHV